MMTAENSRAYIFFFFIRRLVNFFFFLALWYNFKHCLDARIIINGTTFSDKFFAFFNSTIFFLRNF